MKIIVPMAGMGKRMRPHTLTVPKPLIPVAGKPIVQRLVEDIARTCEEPVEEVVFIIGDFGKEVEAQLVSVAEGIGAKGTIAYQEEALGTAHAILCAGDALDGKLVVAFADTLFVAQFKLDDSKDGIIWVHQVEDPSAFGVVTVGEDGSIDNFVEKPETFVSDKAIIGIYYFKDGQQLRSELQYLLDNDIRDKGEYQLTSALENMKTKGVKFFPGAVDEWLDCGNKNATVYTNQRVLEHLNGADIVADHTAENAVIIPPCYIGEGVSLKNAIIGPHVSVGSGSVIEGSVISNSIVQNHSRISNANISNSMLGNHAVYEGKADDLSVGDYNTVTSS